MRRAGPRLARGPWFALPLALLSTTPARAHTAEQALVRLMPTDLYIGVGTALVALTALMLWCVPAHRVRRWFGEPEPVASSPGPTDPAERTARASLLVTAALALLVLLGLFGPHDPLANLLPLSIWTLWWVGIVTGFGLLGPSRLALNPWSGVLRHGLCQPADAHGPLPLAPHHGAWPGVLSLLALNGFVLADPAPDDPSRLAGLIIVWWAATLLIMLAVGERAWLARGECLSMLVARFAALSPWQPDAHGRRRFGMPGRALWHGARESVGAGRGGALFCLVILGCGSFDGLADTFLWLDAIGVNPLAFPGRSAVVVSTLLGLLGFNALLVASYALAVWLGTRLAGTRARDKAGKAGKPGPDVATAFHALAPSVLPIAFGYHASHHLGSFLVDTQYALVALGDPLGRGADPFGLGPWFVSTGMFNAPASVALIWFVQAAAVVIGHILSILLAHRIALDLHRTHRRAFVSQLPLVLFMLGYTLFGLWLLATPRGV